MPTLSSSLATSSSSTEHPFITVNPSNVTAITANTPTDRNDPEHGQTQDLKKHVESPHSEPFTSIKTSPTSSASEAKSIHSFSLETQTRLQSLGISLDIAADLHFFTTQVYHLLLPLLWCMGLSMIWVQCTPPLLFTTLSTSSSTSSSSSNSNSKSVFTVYTPTDTDSTSQVALGSLANAGIILGNLILMTCIIVILIKYQCFKILSTLFALVMASVFGITGFVVCVSIIEYFGWIVDLITLSFALYNFTIVGVISIFWKSPVYVRQAYLVILSSLMAYSMSRLQEWTVWFLLGLLILWDLFAVFLGPLKTLLNIVEQSNQPDSIHMLMYTVTTTMTCILGMAKPTPFTKQETLPSSSSSSSSSSVSTPTDSSEPSSSSPSPLDRTSLISSSPPLAPPSVSSSSSSSSSSPSTADPVQPSSPPLRPLKRGISLGLGDFVFYSVLALQAFKLSTFMTSVICMLTVLIGFLSTMVWLMMKKTPLPALPISLSLGISAYFLSNITIVPYMQWVNKNTWVI